MIPFLISALRAENLKALAILLLAIAAVWFYRDYTDAKAENTRLQQNATQLRKIDSLQYAAQSYSKAELQQYLDYQRADLRAFLEKNKVNTKRIERIVTQTLNYSDTASRRQDLTPVLEAIKQNRRITVPIVDSTSCLIVRGFVVFDADTLALNITDRQFKNTSDVISYWQRRQWKFLGIRTRFLGRKEATVIIKDACGNTQTIVIDKRKK